MSDLAKRQSELTNQLADLSRRLMETAKDAVAYRAFAEKRDVILWFLDEAANVVRELTPIDAELTALAKERASERQAALDAQLEQIRAKAAAADAEIRARRHAEFVDRYRREGF